MVETTVVLMVGYLVVLKVGTMDDTMVDMTVLTVVVMMVE